MKQKISLIQLGIATVAMFAISLIFGASDIFAAERVWTGDGSDNNLATAANWQGGVAPQDGDTISFGNDEDILEVNNNLSAAVAIEGIVTARSVQVEGSALSISGSISGSGYIRFNNDVIVTDDLAINLQMISFEGNLSGSGNVSHSWSGQYSGELSLYSDDNSSFTGGITLNGVRLCAASNSNIFGSGSAGTSVVDGRLLFVGVNSSVSISENIVLDNTDIITTPFLCGQGAGAAMTKLPHTITLSGNITVAGPVVFSGLADLIITGSVVGGSISVDPDSVANLTVNGQAQTGQTRVVWTSPSQCQSSVAVNSNRRHLVNTNCSDSSFSVAGVLGGTGRVGEVYIQSGGTIAPGESPGVINTGDLDFQEGGIYEFEVAGAGNGQYDQINVTGSVDIDGGILEAVLLGDFTPSLGQTFVIINNDGSDAVQGTFADLPEGAVVEIDGEAWFTISYKGGDGNDVELTALPGPARTGGQPEVGLPVVAVFTGAITTVVLAGFIIKRRFMTR